MKRIITIEFVNYKAFYQSGKKINLLYPMAKMFFFTVKMEAENQVFTRGLNNSLVARMLPGKPFPPGIYE